MIRRALLLALLLLCTLSPAADFLPPTLAFRADAVSADGENVDIRFVIAEGYYLYRDRLAFASHTPGIALGSPQLPPGRSKMDENFGQVDIYDGTTRIRLPLLRTPDARRVLALEVTLQGCAEDGLCYPPQRQTLTLDLPAAAPVAPAPLREADEARRIARFLDHAGFWLIVASFFGFGLLLSLTPCVFPMIPILSGIIVNSGHERHGVSHARGFALSLAYVLGMATSYAAAGVAAGFSGTLLSQSLQNPWVLGTFALIFVVLAFSMFGGYELQLPTPLQNKVRAEASHFGRGSLPALAIMGAISALIVGPCVAAPLAGALLYIGQTGNALLGGVALFCMGFGMGVPLLAVGLSAGSLLPKGGAWMDTVKKFFGLVLLGSALWIISPFLTPSVRLAGWALLLIVPAARLLHTAPTQGGDASLLRRVLCSALLALGGCMLLAAFTADLGQMRAIPSFLANVRPAREARLNFVALRSSAELDARLAAARQPVLLKFSADWCIACQEMERGAFTDPRVQRALSGWLLLQADVTQNGDPERALLARFGLFGPPALLFFDRQGKEIDALRAVGAQDAAALLERLTRSF